MAQMDQVRATLEVIDKRISELRSVLDGLRDRGIAALDELESEPFDAEIHVQRFQAALTLALAVRDVATSQVLDDSGGLTDGSPELIVK